MQRLKGLLGCLLFINITQIWAMDDKTAALMSILTTPQPVYQLSEKVDFDPRLYPKHYQIGWVHSPIIEVDRKEYQRYQRPILVKMTVIAAQGKIAKVEILRSTGSQSVDRKILQALQDARLEPIRYADANLTYVLEHQFEVEKPL